VCIDVLDSKFISVSSGVTMNWIDWIFDGRRSPKKRRRDRIVAIGNRGNTKKRLTDFYKRLEQQNDYMKNYLKKVYEK
jgi:hypothetical protein